MSRLNPDIEYKIHAKYEDSKGNVYEDDFVLNPSYHFGMTVAEEPIITELKSIGISLGGNCQQKWILSLNLRKYRAVNMVILKHTVFLHTIRRENASSAGEIKELKTRLKHQKKLKQINKRNMDISNEVITCRFRNVRTCIWNIWRIPICSYTLFSK